MKFKIIIISAVLTFFIHPVILSQPASISFKQVLTHNDLKRSEARYLTTDEYGFKWIATDNGLLRFDGKNLKFYISNKNITESLASNNISMLASDTESILWIATPNGLNRYLPRIDKFEVLKNNPIDPATISDNEISIVCPVKNFIIAATKDGLDLIDSKTLKVEHCLYPKTELPFKPKAIVADHAGKIWLCETNTGLYRFEPATKKFSAFHTEANGKLFQTLYLDSAGLIWIGGNGFEIFDTENEKFILQTNELPSEIKNAEIKHIAGFDRDRVLLAGSNFFLFEYKNKTYIPISSSNLPFNINSVSFVHTDHSGIIWIGTIDKGIFAYFPKTNRFEDKLSSINNHPVLQNRIFNAAITDSYGFLWIATDYGLNKLKNNEIIKTYVHASSNLSSLLPGRILSIGQDMKGRIWVSVENKGLSRLDSEKETFTSFIYDSQLSSDASHPGDHTYISIFSDDKNRMWFVSPNGIIDLFDTDKNIFTHYKTDTLLSSACNDKTFIWLTSGKNLFVFDKKTGETKQWQYVLPANSYKDFEINSLVKGKDGMLRMATSKGLLSVHAENKSASLMDELKGFYLHDIFQIQQDSDGNLWLGARSGLYSFNPSNQQLLFFNNYDGICIELTHSSNLNNHEFIFGGKQGAILLNSKQLPVNEEIPKVVLTGFKIYNKEVMINPESPLKQSIQTATEILLNHKQDVFSFEFTSLNFTLPEKNQYAYKLEGWKEEWFYIGNNNSVTFTGINPGKYIFRVKASNNDGIWNENGTSISVIIKKPFRNSIVFYILAFIVVALILYFVYKKREEKSAAEKRMLEEQVKKAVEEVEQKRREIEAQNKALLEKQAEDERRNWIAEGMNEFTDMLRENTSDLQTFSFNIISKLTSFIGANLGILYVRDDEDENNILYKISGSVAYKQKKIFSEQYRLTEGLVGSCAYEKKTFYFDDIPKDYVKIASGLGQAPPRSLLVVPCIFNETVFGVIEMASLSPIEDYKIRFVEELGEKIASTISIVMNNDRTVRLLEQSKEQANMLLTNEEELRQNLEEMRATQEQSEKREMELLSENEALRKENAELKVKIRNLSSK